MFDYATAAIVFISPSSSSSPQVFTSRPSLRATRPFTSRSFDQFRRGFSLCGDTLRQSLGEPAGLQRKCSFFSADITKETTSKRFHTSVRQVSEILIDTSEVSINCQHIDNQLQSTRTWTTSKLSQPLLTGRQLKPSDQPIRAKSRALRSVWMNLPSHLSRSCSRIVLTNYAMNSTKRRSYMKLFSTDVSSCWRLGWSHRRTDHQRDRDRRGIQRSPLRHLASSRCSKGHIGTLLGSPRHPTRV